MHEDGTYVYYQVQALLSVTGAEQDKRWVAYNLAGALFDNITFEQRQGKLGSEYRKLLEPMHDEWQRSGAHSGFEKWEDAQNVRAEIIRLDVKRVTEIRIARVTEMRHTEAVPS